ncbi:hypothetical protein [Dactylosporangium salmoneum]|uniref:Uncharacterized protein n=1 Tax=Dactylosporangium salmoneum TaxID=53361 RepID=A0ABN3HVJ3_9ACTN
MELFEPPLVRRARDAVIGDPAGPREEARRLHDEHAVGGGDEHAAGGGDERAAGGGDERAPGGGDERAPGGGDERAPGGGDERAVAGWPGVRPRWARVSFAYHPCEAEVDATAAAVHLIATYGARPQGEYRFDGHCGLWSHRAALVHHGGGPRDVPMRDPRVLPDEARRLRTAAPGSPAVEALRRLDLPQACLVARW